MEGAAIKNILTTLFAFAFAFVYGLMVFIARLAVVHPDFGDDRLIDFDLSIFKPHNSDADNEFLAGYNPDKAFNPQAFEQTR